MEIFTYRDMPESLTSPFRDSRGPTLDQLSFMYASCIPPEIDSHGAIEYKLHMLNPSPARLEQLTTQLQWRLLQGNGQAIYEIGVRDDGTLVGLPDNEIYGSLHTLKIMAHTLGAWFKVVRVIPVIENEPVSRDTKTQRRLVEVHVFKTTREKDVARVFIIGANNTGKSSLLGKICYDIHDNGRGKARTRVLKHRHELLSGKTSSVTLNVFGYQVAPKFSPYGFDPSELPDPPRLLEDDDQDEGRLYISNYTDKYTCEEVVSTSHKIVMAFDTPGSQTKIGLVNRNILLYAPDVTLVAVTLSNHTRWTEYLELGLRTTSRVAVMLTKADAMLQTVSLTSLLTSVLTKIAGFRRTRDHRNIAADEDGGHEGRQLFGKMVNTDGVAEACARNECCVPVFLISSVSGTGIDFLHKFLNAVDIRHRASSNSDLLSAQPVLCEKPIARPTLKKPVPYEHLGRHTSSCNCCGWESEGDRSETEQNEQQLENKTDGQANFFITSVLDSGRVLTGVVRGGRVRLGHTYEIGFAANTGDDQVRQRRVKVVIQTMQKLRRPCIELHEGDIGSIGIEVIGGDSEMRIQRQMSVTAEHANDDTSGALNTSVHEVEIECNSLGSTAESRKELQAGDRVTVYCGFVRSGMVVRVGTRNGCEQNATVRFSGHKGEYVGLDWPVILQVNDGEDGQQLYGRVVGVK
ncbi:uncharacterized protein V1516DRAFT_565477 [Lipomyces oligophaga]|uniref:uncharacterized protein n=1 Tax=Lipomyces oligophaga TaxID=45792 RepID=UPI0034CDFD77